MPRNTTVTLYIRTKDGYSKPPAKLVDLDDGQFYLLWYEGTKRQAQAVGRIANTAQTALIDKQASLRKAALTPAAAPVAKAEPGAPTVVRDAVVQYLENLSDRIGNDGYGASPRTLAAYKKRLGFLLEFDGVTPLTEVDENYVQRFRKFLREWRNPGQGKKEKNKGKKLGDRYVYNIIQSLNIFLREYNITCAAKTLKQTHFAPKAVVAYTPDELDKFFAWCDTDELLVYSFFLHSMAREREVTFTEVGDLDFTNSVLHIRPKVARRFRLKGKKSGQSVRGRKVPIPREFMEALKEHCEVNKLAPTDLLFTNTEGNPEGHFLKKCKRIAKYAKLSHADLHKFRKTGATLHYKAGIPVPVISAWLGHESLAVTQAYLDISDASSDYYVNLVSNGALSKYAA